MIFKLLRTYLADNAKDVRVFEFVDAAEQDVLTSDDNKDTEFNSSTTQELRAQKAAEVGFVESMMASRLVDKHAVRFSQPPLLVLDFRNLTRCTVEFATVRESLVRSAQAKKGHVCELGTEHVLPVLDSTLNATSIEEAVQLLIERRPKPRREDFSQVPSQLREFAFKTVRPIGIPTIELHDLVNRLWTRGWRVHSMPHVSSGDFVLFCVSSVRGPHSVNQATISKCADRTIFPVAIILVHDDQLDDDSLRSLVTCEERDILRRFLPDETVDALPVFVDFDPCLREKIEDRIASGITPVTCNSR